MYYSSEVHSRLSIQPYQRRRQQQQTMMADSKKKCTHCGASTKRPFKMLGVFPIVGKLDASNLYAYPPGPKSATANAYLRRHFISVNPDAMVVNMGMYAFVAYSHNQTFREPGSSIHYRWYDGGIGCLFRGRMNHMKRNETLGSSGDEIDRITEFYKSKIDTAGPVVESFQVVKHISGNYHAILCDYRDKVVRNILAISCIPDDSGDQIQHLQCGFDAESNCIISDDLEIMKDVCGSSFGPITCNKGILIRGLIPPEHVGVAYISLLPEEM